VDIQGVAFSTCLLTEGRDQQAERQDADAKPEMTMISDRSLAFAIARSKAAAAPSEFATDQQVRTTWAKAAIVKGDLDLAQHLLIQADVDDPRCKDLPAPNTFSVTNRFPWKLTADR
jgi:hypothetical protein